MTDIVDRLTKKRWGDTYHFETEAKTSAMRDDVKTVLEELLKTSTKCETVDDVKEFCKKNGIEL